MAAPPCPPPYCLRGSLRGLLTDLPLPRRNKLLRWTIHLLHSRLEQTYQVNNVVESLGQIITDPFSCIWLSDIMTWQIKIINIDTIWLKQLELWLEWSCHQRSNLFIDLFIQNISDDRRSSDFLGPHPRPIFSDGHSKICHICQETTKGGGHTGEHESSSLLRCRGAVEETIKLNHLFLFFPFFLQFLSSLAPLCWLWEHLGQRQLK